jgi:hypothetical protein
MISNQPILPLTYHEHSVFAQLATFKEFNESLAECTSNWAGSGTLTMKNFEANIFPVVGSLPNQ